MQSRLGHEDQQSRGFERDRLAARVRTSDYQSSVVAADADVYRHYGLFVYERMGCAYELKLLSAVYQRLLPVHVKGQSAFGVDQIKCQEKLLVVYYVVVDLRYPRGQLAQYAVHLGLLVQFELSEFVVHVDYGLRFDEHRCAASALVMHDARNAGSVLLLDRNDVASVP